MRSSSREAREHRREIIVRLHQYGKNQMEIAHLVSVDQSVVSRVLKLFNSGAGIREKVNKGALRKLSASQVVYASWSSSVVIRSSISPLSNVTLTILTFTGDEGLSFVPHHLFGEVGTAHRKTYAEVTPCRHQPLKHRKVAEVPVGQEQAFQMVDGSEDIVEHRVFSSIHHAHMSMGWPESTTISFSTSWRKNIRAAQRSTPHEVVACTPKVSFMSSETGKLSVLPSPASNTCPFQHRLFEVM